MFIELHPSSSFSVLCSNGDAVVVDVSVVDPAVVDEGIEEEEVDVPAPDAMVGVAVVVLEVEASVVANVPWVGL